MSEEAIILTKKGYDDMARELEEIISTKRPQIVDRIREARQLGDLSENFDYEDAKRAQSMMESRVKELKIILSHCEVIENNGSDGSVQVGCKVVVEDLDDEGYQDEYTIVGPAESSPSDGRISYESLVGEALIGKRVGDSIEIDAPGGIIRYKVVSVE
jgi:transcription elongation factor GreA